MWLAGCLEASTERLGVAAQIYAPIGHALGLGPLSAELEDRCFQVGGLTLLAMLLLLLLCPSTQGNLFAAADAFLLICLSVSACMYHVGASGGSPAPHAHILSHVYQVDSTPTW